MKPLYEIASDILALLDTTDDGELAPGVEQRLDALQMAFDAKVEACCKIVRDYEAEETAMKAEAARFAKRAQSAANGKERLKAYVKNHLDALGIAKMDAGIFKVRCQANSVPSVRCSVDPADLPTQFNRIKVELNAAALADAWKAGEELPAGVEVVKGSHLRIS